MARANYTPDALLLLTNFQYNLTNADQRQLNADMEEVKDPVQRQSFGRPPNPFEPKEKA